MVTEFVFTAKDIVFFSCLLFSVAGGWFTVKFMTEKNKIQINELREQIREEKKRTDKIHEDLTEVKGLLMEIKGYLNKKN